MSGERRERRERGRRRQRGVTESLLSIVLGLEAFVAFFAMLAAYGLRELDAVAAFAGGGATILVLVLLAGLQRHAWAVWTGAALQLLLVASGVVLPLMFVIGAGFAAMWVWCFLRARQIETHQRAAPTAAEGEAP